MHIGFLNNQLDCRGTGNAIYNYAHYNEEILGNKSTIYTFSGEKHDAGAYAKFKDRFKILNTTDGFSKLDALYHIKSGNNDDDDFSPMVPYLVHSVFDNEPHGTIYATISEWMGERFKLPYVPHIVEIFQTDDDLRNQLNIPKDAIVFARYGGVDTFTIDFAWDVINELLQSRDDVYFLFMNTNEPNFPLFDRNRIIFLPSTVDPYEKRKFINTSDAFLHARLQGETFGIAVGEFAIAGKPIITYSDSPERSHLFELGETAYLYNDRISLLDRLKNMPSKQQIFNTRYMNFTPEKVMNKFKEVFLI